MIRKENLELFERYLRRNFANTCKIIKLYGYATVNNINIDSLDIELNWRLSDFSRREIDLVFSRLFTEFNSRSETYLSNEYTVVYFQLKHFINKIEGK